MGPVAQRVAATHRRAGECTRLEGHPGSGIAVIFPSLVAPIFVLSVVAEVGPVPSNTSLRLITSFTGRPVFLDRIAASGSR